MFEFVKKRAFMLFVASLAMGMAGCSDDDPDYDNVTPPQVAVAANMTETLRMPGQKLEHVPESLFC